MARYLIITLTLNTSVDKTYTVENFAVDGIFRPSEVVVSAGGKGINVARMLATLGVNALATGFAGGHNGEMIEAGLQAEGIDYDFVRTRGESRLCIKIADPVNRTGTEVNETGPEIGDGEIEALSVRTVGLLANAGHVVLSGSAPPGVPADFYARIISAARTAGVVTVLDSSGEHFTEGIKAGPDIVKPNVSELSDYVGHPLDTFQDVLAGARTLVSSGVGTVIVSMGRSGAIATDGVDNWHASSPEIEFASAVGSGDTMLAAFLWAISGGESLDSALAAGTAAGAGNAMTYGPAFCSLECFEELRPQVKLTRLA